jgi:hypothetical protein
MNEILLAADERRRGDGRSCLAVSGRTGRADNHFLDDLLARAAGIVSKHFLGFLPLFSDYYNVCPRTVRVLLAAAFQDYVLGGSSRQDEALTQLAPKHRNEPLKSFGLAQAR